MCLSLESQEEQAGRCGWGRVSWAKGNRSGVQKIARGRIMQPLCTLERTLDSILSFWVSRKHNYNNMADLEIPQQYPQENLELCQSCFALAHDDCQETRCCCLKNILQLPGFNALQFPPIIKPPKQHRMKTNMGKYAMEKKFLLKLLKIYIFGKTKLHGSIIFSKSSF